MMNRTDKLALSDDILMKIEKPERYIGHEVNSVVKDKDNKRRSLYGKAGCFGLTDYGFEYRVLSSAMMSSPSKLSFIWKQLQKALKAYYTNYSIPGRDLIQEAINNSNVEIAEQLITHYNLV